MTPFRIRTAHVQWDQLTAGYKNSRSNWYQFFFVEYQLLILNTYRQSQGLGKISSHIMIRSRGGGGGFSISLMYIRFMFQLASAIVPEVF
jgi:hypothetical protein